MKLHARFAENFDNFFSVQKMVVEREKSGKEQKEAEDLILDIQFDHSGTRFATACADRHIRVSLIY